MWSDSPQLAAPPSEVSSCIKTFPLEIEQITQHIQSLMNSTRDFYIFKDVAIDPAASIPDGTMFDYPVGADVDFELLSNSLTFECRNPQLPDLRGP